ncbi:MAG TPA: PAS domain S-box protein [Bacteroidota bacterium]|nr:PAS domain S-box protein [Bacteroidota bacterium]
MANELSVLIVEDSENDAALIMRQLEKAQYAVRSERVESSHGMKEALSRSKWDLILSDYSLPRFDALSALKLLLESGQDIPFIVVSGTIGEETAVELMRAGAHDYVMKDKLSRLVPVVRRELAESRVRLERRMTEHSLQESEARLRNLIQTARDVIFTISPDGIFTTLNPAFETLTGWQRSEWLGRSFEDLLAPADVPKALSRLKSLMNGEPNLISELKIRTKAGAMIYAELVGTPHLLEGRLVEIIGIARDITERKEAEIALRKSEGLLSDTMKIARLGPWEHDTLADEFIFNDHFYSVFRTTAEAQGGYRMTSSEYVRRFVHPADADLVREEIKKAVEASEQHCTRRLQHRMRYADGEEGYLEVSIFVVKDEEGKIIRTHGVNQDITERVEAERALRESEERYRQFFEDDLTGDFISMVDGTILSCNPAFARIYGFDSVEEAMSAKGQSFYPSTEHRERFLELLREKKKLEYFEEEGRRKDGRPIYLVSNNIGIFDDKGNLVQIKGYIFDDTERRVLEEQLRQSQKMESIGTLAGGIAHDFNNILNNILGFVMQLKKYAGDPVKVMKYGETIEKSATRGAELSAHLLSVSRRKKREEAEFDVAQLVNEVCTLCGETFPRMIAVERVIGGGLPTIRGDRGSLYQVLLNLSVNARDAMPNGGTLTIKAFSRMVGPEVNPRLLPTPASRCVELIVSDTGSGMSDAVREKIFDPFFTTKEQGKGTGLGLSIVYNVVKEHHGTIIVESEEGVGSSFKVYLPAVESQTSKDSSRSSEEFIPQGELVLLVDDEEMMQELGKELLEDNGFHVVIAKDGVEAVEIYRERGKEISLVILDLVMPRMDGGQTYMELKKLNESVKAFFCSGFTSDKVITQLLAEEHLHAIKKPFHPTEFINMVHSTIKGE